jgi:RND family efflux transporter MFP subunit
MRKLQSFVLLAALAGAAAPEPRAAGAQAVESPAAEPRVRIEKLDPSVVGDLYEAVGTVRSRTTSVLSSRIVAAITAVLVQEGDRVRLGQLLMELDDRDVQAQLQKARAGLREAQDALAEVEQAILAAEAATDAVTANRELAESTFERYKALHERRSVSDQEFDEMRAKFKAAVAEERRATQMAESLRSKKRQVLARIEQAQADVASGQNYVGYARIEAPLAGIVTAKHADVGSMASPGVPLITIEDGSRYRFEAVIEESRVGQIRLEDRAEVRIDALPDRSFEGRVSEIVPTSDPESRSIVVKVELASDKTEAGSRSVLRSGFFGRARFTVGQRKVLAVPRKALVLRGQLVGVYVVGEDGTARLRLIQTGREQEAGVEVLSGLEPGDRIVVEGAGTVSDGMRLIEPGRGRS